MEALVATCLGEKPVMMFSVTHPVVPDLTFLSLYPDSSEEYEPSTWSQAHRLTMRRGQRPRRGLVGPRQMSSPLEIIHGGLWWFPVAGQYLKVSSVHVILQSGQNTLVPH